MRRSTTTAVRSAVLAALVGVVPLAAHAAAHDRTAYDRTNGADGYDATQPARGDRIPPGQMPPPGMCRIWVNGVPPGRQARATDCATAEQNVPPNARVIYGGSASGEVERSRRGRPTTTNRLPGGTWPYLGDALAFARGARMSSVATLVPGARNVRLSPRTINGIPLEASFYDRGGQLLEIWRDRNGDGRADQVTQYRNGQVVGNWTP